MAKYCWTILFLTRKFQVYKSEEWPSPLPLRCVRTFYDMDETNSSLRPLALVWARNPEDNKQRQYVKAYWKEQYTQLWDVTSECGSAVGGGVGRACTILKVLVSGPVWAKQPFHPPGPVGWYHTPVWEGGDNIELVIDRPNSLCRPNSIHSVSPTFRRCRIRGACRKEVDLRCSQGATGSRSYGPLEPVAPFFLSFIRC